MTFLLIVVVVLVGVSVYSSRQRSLQAKRRAALQESEAAAVRQLADEDVTALGEQLQQLDSDLLGSPLDEGERADYQRALDAYESAKTAVNQVTAPEQVRHVTEILEDGRYAIECVRARVDGQPLPTRRPPCFFDPRHGLSVTDVSYVPPGGAPRDVPACALDAERVRVGAEPDVRKVMNGPQRVPYWQGGPAYAPYTMGYFSAFDIMPTMFFGTMMGSVMFGGFGGGYDQGYAAGYDDAQDNGDGGDPGDGGDGGDAGGDGGDFGGGDGGGFDFGGGDGGGFDFGGW